MLFLFLLFFFLFVPTSLSYLLYLTIWGSWQASN